MKPRRVTILVVLLVVAAIRLVSVVASWVGSQRGSGIPLTLSVVGTNHPSGLRVMVTLTNRGSSSYDVFLVTQSRPPTGWKDRSQMTPIAAGWIPMGAQGFAVLPAQSAGSQSLRAPLLGVPWRVAGECYEQEPNGAAKYWFRFRRWLRQTRPSLVIVSPEMPSL